MNPARGPLVERLLAQAARRLSAAGLHPLRLRDDIVAAFDASVREGDAANDIRIALNPADYRRLSPELAAFREDMRTLLNARAAERGWSSVDAIELSFAADVSVPGGSSSVDARFVHRRLLPAVPPANATRRLTPIRNLRLQLPGGEAISVSHLPFTIGRAPGNDLVLASMAVSRAHAEIYRAPDGIAVRDLGSHNGIIVANERLREAPLVDGTAFTVGDVELRVRFEAQ